jgi:hypothetical protein
MVLTRVTIEASVVTIKFVIIVEAIMNNGSGANE